MKITWLVGVVSVAVALQFMPKSAQAFGCPNAIDAAQEVIDKVKGDMGGDMSKQMPKEQMALVHGLLDDAKSRLTSARHNHEKPQGAYDHARAIAKANAARGYAHAADLLHFQYMKK